MTNKFCSMLSNGVFLSDKAIGTRDLAFKPCCYYQEESTTLDRNRWNDNTNWVEQCKLCQEKEIDGKNKSLRLFSKILPETDNNKITHLEIDYSNACNAACGMCHPMVSSKIAKIMREERINHVSVPKVKKQKFIDAIDSLDLSELQYIKFRGGEPLYLNFHKEVLTKIKNPKQTKIFYQTNGSIYPDEELWEIAKDFESICFSFSIDAVKDRFNFIRAGLNWEIVNDNIKKIIAKDKVIADIQCTYNPLNLYYHSELFYYFLENKKINKSFTFNWHPAYDHWGIENTTFALRDLINKKYKNVFNKILDVKPFDKEKHLIFVNSLTAHENRFSLSGKDTFPEVWELAIT